MKQRIVIGALLVECNHFGGIPTDLNSFKRTQYITGQDVLEIADGTLGGRFKIVSHREMALQSVFS